MAHEPGPPTAPQRALERARERLHGAIDDGVGTVDLSDLGLSDLPAEIASLALFTTYGAEGICSDVSLFLGRNDFAAFPPGLLSLRDNLAVLSLRANRLRTLPREVGQLRHLKELSVASNELRFLPFEVERLPSLRLLQAGLNPFAEPGRTDAPRVPSLRELALRALSVKRANIENVLPPELREDLARGAACCVCDGPIFTHWHERLVSKTVHSSQPVTVRYLLCSAPCAAHFDAVDGGTTPVQPSEPVHLPR